MRSQKFTGRLGTWAVLQVPHGYNLLTPLWRYRLLYSLGRPHEPDFRALPLLNLGASPLLVDVGGNIGQSVLSMYAMLPSARIITFEPNPIVRQKIERLRTKFKGLTVMPCGLSDQATEADLFVPVYNGNCLTGLASFDYRSAEEWLNADRMVWFQRERLTLRSERVSVRRLDECGVKPDFIKVDVQGLEYRVLAGGIETLRNCRPIIMAETIHAGSDVHEFVSSLDYRLMEFDGHKFSEVIGKTRRLNQFLVPIERLPGLTLHS